MKKKNIIAMLFAAMLVLICTGCSTAVPGTTQAETTKTEEAQTDTPTAAITGEQTAQITPTPSTTTELPEPTDTFFDAHMFENTYWINTSLEIGYFFKENGAATVYMTETKSEATYSFSQEALTVDGIAVPYSMKDSKLIITYFEGLDVELERATKEQFDLLTKEQNTTPQPDETDCTEYIGLTVKEFVKTGADITGYTGFNGKYKFSAYNSKKNEKYTFTLTGGNIKDALNSKTFDDEYVDVLGDFVISEITVIKLDASEIQKYIGKTVAEFEADGYDINGFMYFNDLILLAYDKNNNCVEITLNGNVSEVYERFEDPFDEDMGKAFAQFTIKTIKYASY